MKTLCFFILVLNIFITKCEIIEEYKSSNIHTVLIRNIENDLLDPIIQLNSNDILKLSFDELGNNVTNYIYSFLHCDSEWKKSDLLPTEYIEGFTENYIENFYFSFNTIIDYVHYECQFPNENINFLLSGNYILLVKNENTGEIILKKKIVVYENVVQIQAHAKRATFAHEIISKQEIDFEIFHSNMNIKNPIDEIKIVIQKNDNWKTIKKNIKPTFIRKNSLEYDYDQEINFMGGNEFRDFDISSLRFFSKNIDTIYIKTNNVYNKPVYLVNLKKDQKRTNKPYFEKHDLNGKLIIQKDNSYSPKNESEYVIVKFNLSNDGFKKDEKIYLFGSLSNWDVNSEFLLKYNPKTKNFEKEILLKQGYYNYQYITVKNNEFCTDLIEGNYYETNNEYTIYVYHKSPWERYERLVGIEKITSNSLN